MNTHAHQLDQLTAACARRGIGYSTLTLGGAYLLGRYEVDVEALRIADRHGPDELRKHIEVTTCDDYRRLITTGPVDTELGNRVDAACARLKVVRETLDNRGAFALGRYEAAHEAQEAATGLKPAWRAIDPIACEAFSDLCEVATVSDDEDGFPLEERSQDAQEGAVDRIAEALASGPERPRSLREQAQEPARGLTYDEARAQVIRHQRAMRDPDDYLAEARQALLWLSLVHTEFAERCPDTYCDDAREGLAVILRLIGERLEVADMDWRGSYNRDGH